MSDKEKMNYRVHLVSGAVWYCHDFGYAKDVAPEMTQNWIDLDIDFVMVEALPESSLNTNRQPTPLVPILYAVEAVEILPEPRIPRWHTSQWGRSEDF